MVNPRLDPRTLALALLYLVGGVLAVLETRFDGGFAFIWVSSAVLLAYLANTSRRDWPKALALCSVASVLVTGFFGLGWAAAGPLLFANMVETILAALLLRRVSGRGVPDDSITVLARFVVATAGLPTVLGAALAGCTLKAVAGAPILAAALNWYLGHALGFLTFTPLFGLIFSGELNRRRKSATFRQTAEFATLICLVALVAMAVFSQNVLPLLFLPVLPIMLTTFRAGRLGAGLAIIVLAVVAAYYTAAGQGPVNLIDADTGTRARFLQFYLASIVLTVLPIAVELARRQRLAAELRQSEARYRVLAEHSTDIIMNLDVDGTIRFVSPAIRQLAGYDPDALIGRQCLELIDPDYHESVRAAHSRALDRTGAGQKVEYLGVLKHGGRGWFETHTRAVLDDNHRVTGAVSVIRDIGERKALEARLSDAALRDPLTGLLNRRGFMRECERAAAEDGPSAIALFDLDYFKRVNDRYGHDGGDEVLKLFARLATEAVRHRDAVGRLGGEEFAILLRGTGPVQAQAICERLRKAVAETPCRYGEQRIAATVSGGVAALGQDVAWALRSADAALYQAKEAGRDRLALAA
ncbi:diguanylate cyclase [Sphingomonas sp. ID1715]|uniref:sensor domain-containing diguanylate cyclase n=1 Tax=Sphingomonas sp. ID1715 TaxID=1656898 RepID=UPI001487FDA9|nr:diguanylate cyclase [Sphingomonas sp. ID1715]NNM76095.1 diguanylate cyclase [Sphingomonas sp. ID1715]